jgi:hypothetical protein
LATPLQDPAAATDLISFLNELLGTHVARPPSDSTFRLLLAQLDAQGFEALLQQWIAARSGLAETVDTRVCDGRTLRGSIAENASGAARFIAQVSLCSNTLGGHRPEHLRQRCRRRARGPAAAPGSRGAGRASGASGRAAWEPRFFRYPEQRGAAFLIAVNHSGHKGSQVISERLTGGRRVPFQASQRERKRGRDLTWTL